MTPDHPKNGQNSLTCEFCGELHTSVKTRLETCVVCHRKMCPQCNKGHLCKTHYKKLPKLGKSKVKSLVKNAKNLEKQLNTMTSLLGTVAFLVILIQNWSLLLIVALAGIIAGVLLFLNYRLRNRLRNQIRKEYNYRFPVKIYKKDLCLQITD